MTHAYRFVIIAMVALLPSPIIAGVAIGLSGSAANNNLGLETSRNNAVSANVNFDILEWLRIGFTHRRSLESGTGYKRYSEGGREFFVEFDSETRQTINSLDLIVVLYNGIVSPYIFGGVAHKDYEVAVNCSAVCSTNAHRTMFPVENYGFGVGIYLSREFSLKISETYSPGYAIVTEGGLPVLDDLGNELVRKRRDSYTQIGITYHL